MRVWYCHNDLYTVYTTDGIFTGDIAVSSCHLWGWEWRSDVNCAATSSFSPSKMTPKPSKTIRTFVDSWLIIVTHPHEILMNGWFIEPNHFQLVYPFDEEIGLHNTGLCRRFAWADVFRDCRRARFHGLEVLTTTYIGMKFGHGCNTNCTCSEIGTSLVIIITTPLLSE